MRWFVASIVVFNVAGGIWQSQRHTVPAYSKWGAHSELCNTTGTAENTWDFEDPIAAFTSLLFLTASVDDDVVVGVAGILASASFMLHAFETEHSRELDFSIAAGLPIFLAFSSWPLIGLERFGYVKGPVIGSVLLGVFVVLQYEKWISDLVVFIIGAVILFIALILKDFTRFQLLGLALSGLGAGLAIGGDRNTAICNDDVQMAFVYDARHSAWHINAALLLWQAIGILRKTERKMYLQSAVIGLIPLIARLFPSEKGSFDAWVAVFSVSTVLFFLLLLFDYYSKFKNKPNQGASFGFNYNIF